MRRGTERRDDTTDFTREKVWATVWLLVFALLVGSAIYSRPAQPYGQAIALTESPDPESLR